MYLITPKSIRVGGRHVDITVRKATTTARYERRDQDGRILSHLNGTRQRGDVRGTGDAIRMKRNLTTCSPVVIEHRWRVILPDANGRERDGVSGRQHGSCGNRGGTDDKENEEKMHHLQAKLLVFLQSCFAFISFDPKHGSCETRLCSDGRHW